MLKKIVIAIMTIILLSGCSNTSSNTTVPPNNTSKIKNYNNYVNSFVQSDDEYVYVGNMNSIYRAPLSTTDFECIYYDEDIYINKIALSDNNIYFSTVENLYSIDKNGNNLSHIIEMAEHMGQVFWLEFYCFNEEIYLKHNDKIVKLESISPEITYSDPLEKLYYNPYGAGYEYVESTEKGDGKLFLKDANIFIPENENILNENLFIFTDNYIYFVTGQNNDFSDLSKIYQCNFDGSELKEIAEINSQIQFVFFDDKNVYFHDYKNYYYIDISTGDISKTDVVYQGEGVYEICDGNLYSVYTLNPFVINIKDATKKELISIK